MDLSQATESFRGLVLRHRGRTGLTQRQLAARLAVDRTTVQDWETGDKFPTAERLQALIRALLESGGLTTGQESTEAHALWAAALREAPRMRTPFDEDWFAPLLAVHASPSARVPGHEPIAVRASQLGTGKAKSAQDWAEAPDTVRFIGRAEELALLQTWLRDEHCHLVAVLGFGGIGKTSLAARSAQQVATDFERVYWRSLRNAPPVNEWLAGAIGFLSDQEVVPPPSESELIATLLRVLRTSRCLLVLDNSETLFEPGQREVRYRAGMDGYGRVLQAVGEAAHLSCLLLTSREAPPELTLLPGSARWLELQGLGTGEVRALLAEKQLIGDSQAWDSLVERYGGNGLALKIVGETIGRIYDGDIAAFLREAIASYGTVFGGIRRLLDVQVERLSPVEYNVLTRLAVEREPIGLAELSMDMPPNVSRGALIEAIETMRQRSLLERGDRGATFTLQSMVLEYMTDRLVQTIADEIEHGDHVLLVEQALLKAQAKDYVRHTQERLIGAPILQRLTTQFGQEGTEARLLALLNGWRGRPAPEQGYGPGNVVNLLRLLRGNLRNIDLSRLALRQVFLQGVDARDATLAGTHLAEAVLDEAFPYSTAVALSADGALLAAGTPTGELRLWRAADRTLLQAVHGHTGMVMAVALSATGQWAASAGFDGTILLWNAPAGHLLATLQGHTGVVYAVALSGDGRRIASGGSDGTVRLWDAESGQLLANLEGHIGVVWSVALSEDGRRLASGGEDMTVQLWDAEQRKPLDSLRGHTAGVRSVALSGDGQLLASASFDGTVRLWEAQSGQLLAKLQGHTGVIYSLALSADGQLLASGGVDGTVRLWDAPSGQLLAVLQGHTGLVMGVALSQDGRVLASGGADGMVRLWAPASGQLVATLEGHTGVVLCVALSREGQLLASGGLDGTVWLWGVDRGQLLAILLGHTGLVRSVALSTDAGLLASASWDGTVRLWMANSGKLMAELEGHIGLVMGVALSTDGRVVASGGADGTVRLWEAQTGQPLAILHGHTGLVMSVAFSGDSRLVASGGWDATVRLWQTGTGKLLATLQGHTGQIWCVALSADGQLIVSGGADATVRLWDARDGRLAATLQGHTGTVYCVDVSADGQLVVSGGVDGTVRLWEAHTGRPLAMFPDHAGVVWSVALSEDGQLLASGGDDGMVRVWQVATGACLHVLRGDRRYQRLDITGLTGVTEAQREALLALGATERPPLSGTRT